MKEVENMRASLASDLIRVAALVSLAAGIGLAIESWGEFSSVSSYLKVLVPVVLGVSLLFVVRGLRQKSQKEAYRVYLERFDDEELRVSRKQSLSATSLEVMDDEIKARAAVRRSSPS